MINDKALKQLKTTEMIRCEVTGKFVPIEDCEVVVIKIIKAKDADMNGFNPFAEKTLPVSAPFVAPVAKVAPTAPVDSHKDANVLTVEDVTRAPKNRSIVPPAFANMMLDPSHPQFESRGAKITRRV